MRSLLILLALIPGCLDTPPDQCSPRCDGDSHEITCMGAYPVRRSCAEVCGTASKTCSIDAALGYGRCQCD